MDILFLSGFMLAFSIPMLSAKKERPVSLSEFSREFLGDLRVINIAYLIFIVLFEFTNLFINSIFEGIFRAFWVILASTFPFVLSLIVLSFVLQWMYKIRWRKTKNALRFFYLILILFFFVFFWEYILNSGNYKDDLNIGYISIFALSAWLSNVYAFRIKQWVSIATKPLKRKILINVLFNLILVSIILSFDEYPNSTKIHVFPFFFLNLNILLAIILFLNDFRILYYVFVSLPTSDIIDRRSFEINSLTYLNKIILNIKSLDEITKIICQLTSNSAGNCPAWVEWKEQETKTILCATNIDIEYLNHVYINSKINRFINNIDKPTVINSLSELLFESGDYSRANIPFESWVVCPIHINGVVTGHLVLAFPREYYFDYEIVRLLSAYIENMRASIENIRKLEILIENEKLQKELQIARAIQTKLLPTEVLNIPGLEIATLVLPAEEVGGDFFDIISFGQDSFCFLIGDVSGKGMSAAFYMALLKGVILSIAQTETDLKNFIIKINNALYFNLDKQIHITISALLFDFSYKKVSFVRAGHMPLFHINQDGINIYQPKGIALPFVSSKLMSKLLDIQTLSLHEGDYFFLYTDGLVESLGNKNILVGMQELKLLLQNSVFNNAEDLKAKVMMCITEKQDKFQDDITLIILKVAKYGRTTQ